MYLPRSIGFYSFIALASSALLLLSSCSSPPPLFRVATNTWVGYEPLYLARDLGHYDHAPIRFIEMPNTSEVLQAFRNGVLEAAALTLDETLTLLQDGYDLRVVLVFDFSQGADVVMARPPIKTPADLKGQRVGVENTAVGATLLDAALRHAQLRVSDITLLRLPIDQHERAYLDGEVDAVVTFEPTRSRLLTQGARVIFDSGQIPQRIVDVLVVSADAVQKPHLPTLKALLQGYFAALTYLQTEPEKAAEKMSKRLKLPPQQVLQALQGLHFPSLSENHRLLGDNAQLLSSVQALQALMLKHHLLRRPASLERLLNATALAQIP